MPVHNIFKITFLIGFGTIFSWAVPSNEFVLKEHIRIDESNIFDEHTQLSVAKVACSNDQKCIGIYEASCDKNGPFMLLRNSFVTSVFGTSCIYKKRQYDPTSKCFDVSMYKSTSDFGWSFGNCSGSDKWLGSGTYTDKCCTSDVLHILSCSTSSHDQRDWSSTVLTMLGHQFCDDFAGHNAFISLNVSGTYT